MQEQTMDGIYKEPEKFDAEKLEKDLLKERLRKVCVFVAHDEDDKPTPELRRAWRRHERTTNKRR